MVDSSFNTYRVGGGNFGSSLVFGGTVHGIPNGGMISPDVQTGSSGNSMQIGQGSIVTGSSWGNGSQRPSVFTKVNAKDVDVQTQILDKPFKTDGSNNLTQSQESVDLYVTTSLSNSDAYLLYSDYKNNLYDREYVFEVEHKNVVLAYDSSQIINDYLIEDINFNSYLDSGSYHLFKLNKILEQRDAFVYLSYDINTGNYTYKEYKGIVQTVDDYYIGDNIPKYTDLVYKEGDIIPESINVEQLSAIKYLSPLEDEPNAYEPWWIVLFSYKMAPTSKLSISEIQEIIDNYTLLSPQSILKYNANTKSYAFAAFDYFVPQRVRYKNTLNNYYTSNPVYEETIKSNNLAKAELNSQENDKYIRIEFGVGGVDDETKITNAIDIIVDDELYCTPQDNSETTYINKATNNIYLGSHIIDGLNSYPNSSTNVYSSISYTFIEDGIINRSYVTSTFPNNYIDIYLHLSLFDSISNAKISKTIRIKDDWDSLFTYSCIGLNELDVSEQTLRYYDYLKILSDTSGKYKHGETFNLLISYNTTSSWEISNDSKIIYTTDRVFPKNLIDISYSYYNPLSNSFDKYNYSVLNIYGENYGIIPSVSYVLNVIPVKPISYSNDDKQQLSAISFETNVNKSFELSNTKKLVFNGDYEYVPPLLSYSVDQKNNDIKEQVLWDGYWKRNYDEEIVPIVNVSYTYISQPYELSKNNVSPFTKPEVLGWQKLNEITYNQIDIKHNEEYYYVYIAYVDNKSYEQVFDESKYKDWQDLHIYDAGDGINFIASYYENKGDKKRNIQSLIRKLKVTTSQELVEKVYQEEGLSPINAYIESSFGISNRKQVIITDQVYVPPTYIDIVTVDPVTMSETIKTVQANDGYYAYSYVLEDIPLKTASYIYNQNPLDINKIDELIDAISNIKGSQIYYNDDSGSLANAFGSAMGDIVSKGITIDLSYLEKNVDNGLKNLYNITKKWYDYSLTQSDKQEKIYLNSYVNNLTSYLVSSLNELSSSLSKDNSNNIEANKKMVDKITYRLEYQNTLLSYIGNRINRYGGVTALGRSSDIGYTYTINRDIAGDYKNWVSIERIAWDKPYKEDVVSYTSKQSKSSKVAERSYTVHNKTVKHYTSLGKPEYITSSYAYAFSNDIPSIERIGLHLAVDERTVKHGAYWYNYTTYSYQGIADILANLKVRPALPTKQEFIIDVARSLFVYSDFVLSDTSPNEYAKRAIYRADALWEELVNANYIDKPSNIEYSYAKSEVTREVNKLIKPRTDHVTRDDMTRFGYDTNIQGATLGSLTNDGFIYNEEKAKTENDFIETNESLITSIFGNLSNFKDATDKMLKLETAVRKDRNFSILSTIYQDMDAQNSNDGWIETHSQNITATFGSTNDFKYSLDRFIKLERDAIYDKMNGKGYLQSVYQILESLPTINGMVMA